MSSRKTSKEKVACVDACFIEGDFIKAARSYKEAKSKRNKNYGVEIKISQRLRDILSTDTSLFITPVAKYEIFEGLIFSENLRFDEAKQVYLNILERSKNLIEMKRIDKDLLSDDRIFQSLSKLKNKLSLCDVLNVEIARNAGMPIITSERKAYIWKLLYEKAYSQEDAWTLFRKKI